MRVIAGTARHLPLKTPSGLDTRPTTDRIKETLFNILQNDIYGCSFLDLFSGSGGIGIEALSRGAEAAVFVDNSREAIDCIRSNLAFTKLEDHAVVMTVDAVTAIRRLKSAGRKFDLVFIDPPYRAGLEETVLAELHDSGIVKENGRVIVEASLDNDLQAAEACGFVIDRVKQYKTNQHYFLSPED